MRFRSFAILFSMTFLVGLTACSTTGEAEADESAETAEQRQTQEEADDHEAHHPDDEKAAAEESADKQREKGKMGKMCPMQVEDTEREVVKLDDAVAMEFTTTGDVEELRERVDKMAKMHQKMHGEGGHMQKGKKQQGKMQGKGHRKKRGEMSQEQREKRQQMKQMMADVTIEAEEIDDGARIKFTPEDPDQVDQLFEKMQQHVQMMEEGGECPMMQKMGGDSAEEQSE